MYINNFNPNLIYIGSSLDLGHRLNEYYAILTGSATNEFTKLLYANNEKFREDWTVIILILCQRASAN